MVPAGLLAGGGDPADDEATIAAGDLRAAATSTSCASASCLCLDFAGGGVATMPALAASMAASSSCSLPAL